MPEIVRFYGLIIKMFSPSRLYVLYDECIGVFDISPLEMLEGDLPPRAVDFVREWAGLHQSELLEMRDTQQIRKLQPLM